MTDETQNALTAFYDAYPKTQYVDYSGFIDAFQPVLNNPSMYVPQQGLLQNTPTLADITLDPTIDAYSPFVTGLLQSYPQMEQDFQSTFAVDPNTYRNFATFNRLPFDKSYWENVVGGGGSGGDGLDLGGVDEAGLIGNTNTGGGGSGGDGGTDIITVDSDDGTDGSSGTDGTIGTTITLTGGTNTSGTSTTDGSQGTQITLSSSSDSSDSDTVDGGQGTEIILSGSSLDDTSSSDTVDGSQGTEIILSGANTLDGGDGNDIIDNTNDTISLSGNTNLTNIINSVDTTNKTTATNDINTLVNSNVLSNNATSLLTSLIDSGVPIKTAVGQVVQVTSGNITDVFKSTSNVINPATIKGLNITTDIGTGKDAVSYVLGLDDDMAGYNAIFDSTGFHPDFKVVGVYENGVKVGEKVVQKNWLDKQFDKFGNWYNTPLNEGFGKAGSALNNATQFTPAEVVSGIGGLLSAMSAIEDGNPSNVFNTAVGAGGTGLLGGSAYGSAEGAKGALGFATHPATAIVGTLLMIAQQHAPDPSNKTGFAGFDAETRETTSFGMEGDKFKQANVDKSTSIATAMGDTVNVIADSFGLNAKGDILAQTGNRDPLNITFGNQESEQTVNDRLNYNPEMGDITRGDNIQRWYYTGQNGIDGAKLASDTIHGTTLLALKAKANGEDSINLANMTLPTRSADEVKNTYLAQGFDEVAADALTSAARSASPATSELLGGLLLANTTNEANYLTPTERESLIEQGFTNEQLDTMLYGTSEQSLAAITLLNTNEENNEENI